MAVRHPANGVRLGGLGIARGSAIYSVTRVFGEGSEELGKAPVNDGANGAVSCGLGPGIAVITQSQKVGDSS
ncbi:hypothetical protein [Brooklawnia sp.]|uniref:hypothetical protein n=1 Tax=Brooklawnia sp. TaxID=2699740 RepID=UPI0031200E75